MKARLPTAESLTGGTRRRLVLAERSVRRPGSIRCSPSLTTGTHRGVVLYGSYSMEACLGARQVWIIMGFVGFVKVGL